MKASIAILLLLAAAFAAQLNDDTILPVEPVATAASTVVVHSVHGNEAKDVNVSLASDSVTSGGVTATTTGEVREKNGTLTISNHGIEKTITWTPDSVQMTMETRGVSLVKTMNLTLEGGHAVYIVKSDKELNVGGGASLPVAVETTVSAETGEVTNETEVINPTASGIAISSAAVPISVRDGRMEINSTLVNATEVSVEVTMPQRAIAVSATAGGASIAVSGATATTTEAVEVSGSTVTVASMPVAVMPDEAKAKVTGRAQVSGIVLEKSQNKLQYRITAAEQKRILGIIPAEVESTTTVDATSGASATSGPWWGFLAF